MAEDSRLFQRYRIAGLTQPPLVVEVDRCNDRHLRIDDVYRVEPAAQPYLKHQHIDVPGSKNKQGGQRGELEIGQRCISPRDVDRLEGRNNLCITNLGPRYPDAFIEAE